MDAPSKFLVLFSKFLVLFTRFLVLFSRYQVPSTEKYQKPTEKLQKSTENQLKSSWGASISNVLGAFICYLGGHHKFLGRQYEGASMCLAKLFGGHS